MSGQMQARFRSDVIVKRAGRFRFDGFVDAGWKPPPHDDELVIDLTVGEHFPRVGHACWWAPVDKTRAECVAQQRMSWEGGPAAPAVDRANMRRPRWRSRGRARARPEPHRHRSARPERLAIPAAPEATYTGKTRLGVIGSVRATVLIALMEAPGACKE